MKMLDRLMIRCGKREKESYRLIAEHRGMELSHWARMILRDEARKYSKEHDLEVSFVGDEVNEGGLDGEPTSKTSTD